MTSRRRWASPDALVNLLIVATCGVVIWSVFFRSPARRRTPDEPLPKEPISLQTTAPLGSATASVGLVVFSEFQCPFCGRFEKEAWPQIEEAYVRTGKLRVFFRHFPLENIHPLARRASVAAECAAVDGQFWEIARWLFESPAHLQETELRTLSTRPGVVSSRFQACLDGPEPAQIGADMALGKSLSIGGTPTFFIGRISSDSHLVVSKRLKGAEPFEVFKSALDPLLR